MRIRTLLLYLIGNRQAILDLAADRRALWVSLVFVISAGFAREYDGEDLLREPWYLLIPVAASLGASFVLFLVACGSLFFRADRLPFLSAYRSFLTLFWMTAPLAWLYGIPYERFLSPVDATAANLWTLGLVAAWRVALMVRVVSVLTGRSATSSFFLVMAFADAVALIAIEQMPKPVVSFMGGVRLTESEQIVYNVTCCVCLLGYLTAPVWLIGAVAAFFTGRPSWRVPAAPATPVASGRWLWVLAAASVLVWIPPMIHTQKEQQLRTRIERDLKAGLIIVALDEMSQHQRRDFPPGWEPPPRVGFVEEAPHILDVMDVLVTREVAPWVREEFVDKFRRYLGEDDAFYSFGLDPSVKHGDKLARAVRILEQIPEGPEIASRYVQGVKDRLSHGEISAGDRTNLEALLKLAGNR